MFKAKLHIEVFQILRRLRRMLRRRLVAEGLCHVVIVTVAYVAATLALDYLLDLDRPLRIVLACMGWGWIGWTILGRLVKPLAAQMGDNDLALIVEQNNPHLADRLASALQFDKDPREDSDASSHMKQRLVQWVNEQVHSIHLGGIVERKRLRKQVVSACLVACVLTGFVAWQRQIVQLWMVRNVLFADVAWPQDIYLEVSGARMDEEGHFAIVRGEDLDIQIKVRKSSSDAIVPSQITLRTKYESLGWAEEKLNPDASDSQVFRKTFSDVSQELSFYVTARGERRRVEHHIRLVDPPELKSIQFAIQPPSYMNTVARRLDGTRGTMTVRPGSQVTIEIVPACELKSARMEFAGKTIQFQSQDIQGERLYRESITIPAIHKKDVSSEMQDLLICLEDTSGLANTRAGRYRICIQRDPVPTVRLNKLKVSSQVTPNASVPLIIQASDDNGVLALQILKAVEQNKDSEVIRTIDLQDAVSPKQQKELTLELKSLSLQPGQTLHLSAGAVDTLPKNLDGPNRAVSNRISLRIVKPEDIREELLRRMKQLRVSFEQTIHSQQDSTAKSVQAKAHMQSGQDWSSAMKDSSSLQITVAGKCSEAALSLQAILDEMLCNHLIEQRTLQQMQTDIITPLKELSLQGEHLVARMRTMSDDAAVEGFQQTIEQQRQMLETMKTVLQKMTKVAEAHELANRLQRLIGRWDQVIEDTQKMREKEIEDLFETPQEDQ